MRYAILCTVVAGWMLTAIPAAAHHGAATFDTGKKVTMQATVTEWIWANPHCFLKFDVADEAGMVRHWIAETSNPPDMINRGWARNSFKPGEKVTVEIEPVKNGSPVGRVLQVTLASGKILSTTGGPTIPGEGLRQ
jgi:hypothetical protein